MRVLKGKTREYGEKRQGAWSGALSICDALKSSQRNNFRSRKVVRTRSGMRKIWRPTDRENTRVSNPAERLFKVRTDWVC